MGNYPIPSEVQKSSAATAATATRAYGMRLRTAARSAASSRSRTNSPASPADLFQERRQVRLVNLRILGPSEYVRAFDVNRYIADYPEWSLSHTRGGNYTIKSTSQGAAGYQVIHLTSAEDLQQLPGGKYRIRSFDREYTFVLPRASR